MEATCDNCGATSADREPVHRMYVVPESWDTERSETVLPDVERWCFSCRSMYPHQPAGA